MNDKLKEVLKKIHDPKNNLPIYASVIVRPGKNLLDIKIKKEEVNIIKIIAHEEKKKKKKKYRLVYSFFSYSNKKLRTFG